MPPFMNRIMGMFGNMQNMQSKFRQFQQDYQKQYGNSDPRQIVQKMMDSNKVSQEQFNMVKGITDMFFGNGHGPF